MPYELSHTWNFFGHACDVDYESSILHIAEASTIENFWCVYNNMPKLSHIFVDEVKLQIHGRTIIGFSLFKDSISPKWEDVQNFDGSEWCCRQSIHPEIIEQIWIALLIECVRGGFEHVNGIRVVYKPRTFKHESSQKIEVWMSQNADTSGELKLIEGCIYPLKLNFVLMSHNTNRKIKKRDTN